MMLLRSSLASPFGRKVKLAAAELGLLEAIEIINTDTSDPNDPLRRDNPLGKIPCLLTEEGVAIYDSRVILDYLDQRAGGGKIIPAAGMERIAVLTQQALADGISDAALLQVYEGRFRAPEKHEQKWIDHQQGKVTRGLNYLETTIAPLGARIDVGAIAVACMLGYQDLRFGGRWRAEYPKLVAWLEAFEARVPHYAKTRVLPG